MKNILRNAIDRYTSMSCHLNDDNNNNGFICIAAQMLDYTISAMQDSTYNITQIII